MFKFHSLKIKEVKRETQNAVSIVFEIPTELKTEFNYVAGQYITIKKEINGKEIRRAYSVCSAPNSDELRISVKAIDNGTFSVFATSVLKEGDLLKVAKPEGKFKLETSVNNNNNYLAVAAGSGITPIMAMIKATLLKEPNSTFSLIYGNKTEEETIFKHQLDELQIENPNQLFIQYIYSREEKPTALFGRIDKEILNYVLKNKFKNIEFTSAYLCGPQDLIKTAKDTLIENKIKSDSIHFELFTETIASEKKNVQIFDGTCEITVLLDDEETTFKMDTKNSILKAALKEGLDPPYSCQGGICSSCLAKLTNGSAIMDKNSILSDTEIADGLILTCQAHPTSQKITVDYDTI